jgi:hypothetical protein
MRDDELTAQLEAPGCGRAGFQQCEVIHLGDFVNSNSEWSKQLA